MQERQDASPRVASSSVRIEYLPAKMTEDDIRQMFTRYGHITDVRIRTCRTVRVLSGRADLRSGSEWGAPRKRDILDGDGG